MAPLLGLKVLRLHILGRRRCHRNRINQDQSDDANCDDYPNAAMAIIFFILAGTYIPNGNELWFSCRTLKESRAGEKIRI